MEVIFMAGLGLFGFFGFIICIIMTIVSVVKKKEKKFWAIGIILTFSIFISAVISDSPDKTASNDTPKDTTSDQITIPETTLSKEEMEKKAHDDWVAAQFSLWDGSCTSFVKLVKDNMNNPKSFEHVETKYVVLSIKEQLEALEGKGEIGDLYVIMKFRGTNAFGGVITSQTDALLSYKNNTITLLSGDF
jgi:hypothetical protein